MPLNTVRKALKVRVILQPRKILIVKIMAVVLTQKELAKLGQRFIVLQGKMKREADLDCLLWQESQNYIITAFA